MKTVIVLAMHGMTPRDFPGADKTEFFRLRSALGRPDAGPREALLKKLEALEQKMRQWPRTEANDPFDAAAKRLADRLSRKTGQEVVLGYNEFCAPALPEALDAAARPDVSKVLVITPMVTRGGNHSEEEIPQLVEEAQSRHPNVSFVYAWPFDEERIADFLARQLSGHLETSKNPH
ncbi:MAG TPA: CbiX/SirB N-terminal domain-containing protein [Verrucomicrobiae bacterium]|jgi:sirohydrochlorin cobaltochelatase|nr:CbiX/SirB N-terminal domain-containing protein [Verrucomicrobiae bacterium]